MFLRNVGIQSRIPSSLPGKPHIICFVYSLGVSCRKLAGHVTRIGKTRNPYKILVGNLEGKRLLGRPRHRWDVNINIDLKVIACEGVEWCNFIKDRIQCGFLWAWICKNATFP
jgi:hypothetical protein